MTAATTFRVVFPDWYDERGAAEAKDKGWLQGVEVHFSNGEIESLFFYDPVRLAEDLEAEAKCGRPFIAFPNMVVIPEITRQAILNVVTNLVDSDFFRMPEAASR